MHTPRCRRYLLQDDEEGVEEFIVLGEMEDPHPVVQLAAVVLLLGVTEKIEQRGALLRAESESRRHAGVEAHDGRTCVTFLKIAKSVPKNMVRDTRRRKPL